MAASTQECALLSRANRMAHDKGFLPKDKDLICPFADPSDVSGASALCTGIRCLFAENPQTRFFPLQDHHDGHPVSQVDRFYLKLEKTVALQQARSNGHAQQSRA